MPKILISKSSFEETDIHTRKYNIRYRIISDNQNNLSAFSPIFEIDPGFNFVSSKNNINVEHKSGSTLAAWEIVPIEKNGINIGTLQNFDIWIRFGLSETLGDWNYYRRVSENSINIVNLGVYIAVVDYFSIEVYSPVRPRDQRIVLYEIDQSSAGDKIDLIKDEIIFPANVVQTGDGLRYTSLSQISGLITDTTYFARKKTSTIITLHPTKADAQNNSNKIDLLSHTNYLGYFQWEESLVYDFLLFSAYNVPVS